MPANATRDTFARRYLLSPAELARLIFILFNADRFILSNSGRCRRAKQLGEDAYKAACERHFRFKAAILKLLEAAREVLAVFADK